MDSNGQWGGHMDGFWGWLGGAMMVGWMLLLVVATVAVVIWLLRGRSTAQSGNVDLRSPRDVIDGRYASGEIDEARRLKMIETIS